MTITQSPASNVTTQTKPLTSPPRNATTEPRAIPAPRQQRSSYRNRQAEIRAISEMISDMRSAPMRHPMWRWHCAQEICNQNQLIRHNAIRRQLERVCDGDQLLAGAAMYLIMSNDEQPNGWTVTDDAPGVADAIELWKTRREVGGMIEALTIVGEAPQAIAAELALPVATVSSYQQLFFDVSGRSQPRLCFVFLCNPERFSGRQYDRAGIYRVIALEGGRPAIRELLGLPAIPGDPPFVWESLAWRLKSVIGFEWAHTRPEDRANHPLEPVVKCIELQLRRRARSWDSQAQGTLSLGAAIASRAR